VVLLNRRLTVVSGHVVVIVEIREKLKIDRLGGERRDGSGAISQVIKFGFDLASHSAAPKFATGESPVIRRRHERRPDNEWERITAESFEPGRGISLFRRLRVRPASARACCIIPYVDGLLPARRSQ
jgi:hypothetical protein